MAKEKIELKSKAEMFGDIRSAKLVIEEGVTFVGKTEVNPNKVAPYRHTARDSPAWRSDQTSRAFQASRIFQTGRTIAAGCLRLRHLLNAHVDTGKGSRGLPSVWSCTTGTARRLFDHLQEVSRTLSPG